MRQDSKMSIKEALVAPTPSTNIECCMCGDCGIVEELFQCSVCLFRSQHSYCSNLYPKGGPYSVCNWCLKKEEEKMETPRSLSPSSSHSNENKRNHHLKNKMSNSSIQARTTPHQGTSMSNISSATKKQKKSSVDESSAQLQRKILSKMTKQAFRGKARRYKLLEEVCRLMTRQE